MHCLIIIIMLHRGRGARFRSPRWLTSTSSACWLLAGKPSIRLLNLNPAFCVILRRGNQQPTRTPSVQLDFPWHQSQDRELPRPHACGAHVAGPTLQTGR